MSTTPSLVLIAAVAVVCVGGAVWCIAQSGRPPSTPQEQRGQAVGRVLTSPLIVVGFLVGVAVFVFTGWVVAAIALGAVVPLWPSLFQTGAATRERERVTAIAKWLEDLRDLQRGSNLDLLEALDRSATRAPIEIRSELARFNDLLRHHVEFEDALLGLARDLDHPTADQAVAAMLFAHGHASGSALHETFEELARSARAEVASRVEVDRIRTRFETSMRRSLVLILVFIVGMLVFSPDTFEPYSTPVGQVFLVIPFAMWAGALWWLRSLAHYRRPGQHLNYDKIAEATS